MQVIKKKVVWICVGDKCGSWFTAPHLGYAGENDQAQSGTVETMLIWKKTNSKVWEVFWEGVYPKKSAMEC